MWNVNRPGARSFETLRVSSPRTIFDLPNGLEAIGLFRL